MAVRPYNASVRVGNWYEDVVLEQDLLKDFLERRSKGELIYQKKQAALNAANAEMRDVSESNDGFVHFGDNIMLVNECAEDKRLCTGGSNEGGRNTSSLAVDANIVGGGAPELVVTSLCKTDPCLRNVFSVTAVDGSAPGSPLRYGQEFTLTLPGSDMRLYSDVASLMTQPKPVRTQDLKMVPATSYTTVWRCESFDPLLRLEHEGLCIPANSKLLVMHCKTNQALCVKSARSHASLDGVEYEATAETELDSHKAERDVNHWSFILKIKLHSSAAF